MIIGESPVKTIAKKFIVAKKRCAQLVTDSVSRYSLLFKDIGKGMGVQAKGFLCPKPATPPFIASSSTHPKQNHQQNPSHHRPHLELHLFRNP
jgi:hypothetical protein